MAQPDPKTIHEALAGILSQPEFSDAPSWLERFAKDAFDWLVRVLSALPFGAQIVILVLATLALLAIIASMVRGYDDARGLSRRVSVTLDHDDARALGPAAVLQRARDLAAAGDVRQAARSMEQALILHLCELRGATFLPALSDWEWMDHLQAEPWMRAFTRRAETVAYGPRPDPAALAECFAELAPHLTRGAE